MWRVVLALVATVGLGLIFALAQSIRRPLARLLRALLTGFAILLAFAGLAIGVTGIADEIWWAAIMGGGILFIALRLGWALRRPSHARTIPGQSHIPMVPAAKDDPWRQFESSLDWVGRQQAKRSRALIAGFLAERDSQSLTPDHRSLLLSCEKRVPELLQTCIDRCRNASARERDHYIDETLARLNQIGSEAEQARREVREGDDRRLQVLHRYFDGVAGPKEGPRER